MTKQTHLSSLRRWGTRTAIALFLFFGALILALGVWRVVGGSPASVPIRKVTSSFDAQALLVLADADMAATAYADAKPHPIDGDVDTLFEVIDPSKATAATRQFPAGNTVMGWPGASAASADGRFIYVVEGRGPIERNIEKLSGPAFASVPMGSSLTMIDRSTGTLTKLDKVCQEPMSVDMAANGQWLLIACGEEAAELSVVPLVAGVPQTPRRFDIEAPSFGLRPVDTGATYAVVNPKGAAAGVILQNRAVALVNFKLDASGVPIQATTTSVLEADKGRWQTVARWTRAGNHLLVADVGWGPKPIDYIFNGAGAIVSYGLGTTAQKLEVVSVAKMSLSPEPFEMNRTGDLLAVVNMERTYLPGGLLSLVPARNRSSLSLVSVDDATGKLATIGAPVGFAGVLPEDVVFDRNGDQLAVVIYQNHDALRSNGWVEFFGIDKTSAQPAIFPTGRKIELMRGTHDLLVID